MRQYVALRLGDRKYACDLARVQEIVAGPELEPCLDGPDLLIGMFAGSRGPLPVLDLLGRPPDAYRLNEMALLVFEAVGSSLGLLADDLNSVIEFDPAAALPLPLAAGGVADEFLAGVVELADISYYLLDLDRVVAAYTGAATELSPKTGNKSETIEP